MGAHYNPKMFFILQSNSYYQVVGALISFPPLMNVESLGMGGTEAISIPHPMIIPLGTEDYKVIVFSADHTNRI